ncbi:OsmC family protein [Candidatus Bathyarchaeota archaeon]|nr:OsmC family protein [Candidatus Bathyarchaeota archaeon]
MLTYKTKVVWTGEHWGNLTCSNGPQMKFSAPPALQGHPNVMTPEDAFVGAVNMCIHLMFLWVVEKFKINLLSYECEAEGFVEDLIDRTSLFTKIVLRPKIKVKGTSEERVRKALKLAEKYSLIAQSIKSEVVINSQIYVEN